MIQVQFHTGPTGKIQGRYTGTYQNKYRYRYTGFTQDLTGTKYILRLTWT